MTNQSLSTPDLTAEDALSSYRFIQALIGVVAFVLPVATLWWVWAIDGEHLDSISMTYHSRARNVFVGCLCALGLAFSSYARRGRMSRRHKLGTGQHQFDGWLSVVAGGSAIVVALFPTVRCETEGYEQSCPGYGTSEMIFSTIHAVFTGALMVSIAILCIQRFVRTDALSTKGQPMVKRLLGSSHTVPKKLDPKDERSRKRENGVYRVTGSLIAGSILWIVVVNILVVIGVYDLKPHVGIPESIAVWAFGVAWLTKSGYYGWFRWMVKLVKTHRPSRRRQLTDTQESTPPLVPPDGPAEASGAGRDGDGDEGSIATSPSPATR